MTPSETRPEPCTRRAGPADAAALVVLRGVMFEAMGSLGAADANWRDAARAWFERELAGPHTCVMVAEDEHGLVVSSAMGRLRREAPSPTNPAGVSGAVSNVVTLPGARGRGLARACLGTLLEWFDEETEAGQLELFATGDGAGLYESVGFRVTAWPAMRMRLRR
ncbi:MAG: GNAT family N-acetyltransferase [Terracoccus sp.]